MTSRIRGLACLLVFVLLAGGLAAAVAPDAQAGPSRKDIALAKWLKTQRIQNVKFEEVTLPDFVKWLRIATGKNFMLKLKPLAKAGIDAEEVTITATLEDVTIHALLELVLEPHELAYTVKRNVVWITTHADSLGKPMTKLYPISHITWTKVDFIAPEINLRPSNFVEEDYEPEVVVEDDPLNSGDAVADLLREIVKPEEWDNEGWNLRATDRYLVVRCPKSVHAEVARALSIIATMK